MATVFHAPYFRCINIVLVSITVGALFTQAAEPQLHRPECGRTEQVMPLLVELSAAFRRGGWHQCSTIVVGLKKTEPPGVQPRLMKKRAVRRAGGREWCACFGARCFDNCRLRPYLLHAAVWPSLRPRCECAFLDEGAYQAVLARQRHSPGCRRTNVRCTEYWAGSCYNGTGRSLLSAASKNKYAH